MPTIPGTSSVSLTPQQALEKVTGLISELPDESPETTEPAVPAAQPAATEPVPSETTPPETSDSGEPAPDDDTPHTVLADGEPVTVTLRELKDSYSYKSHNTRKAQELAEKEKRLEPEIRQRVEAEVQADRQQYQQGLQQLVAALEKINGEPDWVQKRRELAPEEFLKQKADWEASKADLDRIKRHEADVADQAQRANAEQFQKYRRAEQDKLLSAVPEWTDTEKAKAEQAKLVSVAKAYGYTEQEVLGVVDHRAILLLRDAMRYRELHREPNAAAKAKTSGIKTAKPGSPERPRPNAEHIKKIERVQRTGRSRDAMDAIADLLPD